jgi:hypothetical protein
VGRCEFEEKVGEGEEEESEVDVGSYDNTER